MPIARIAPSFREKVWGSTGLAPWFAEPAVKTGEVWFESESRLPLIKFLFTTERLSVQVHPDDEHARAHGAQNGKTEMWHILRAGPGAQVAIGFRERIEPELVRDAALNGTIEALLNWITVRPGDTLFVPAGAVHSIGAGLALCEIQQPSDITYRIYDYGRARELHLDAAMEVAHLGPFPGRATLPVRCPYFHTERVQVAGEVVIPALHTVSALIALQGEGLLSGEPLLAGDVWELQPGSEARIAGRVTLLRTFAP